MTDSYAENTESVTLTLGNGSGYGISNGSQTLTIGDDPFVVSLEKGQDASEGGSSDADLGWFTITSNKAAPSGGLRIRYEISGGTAERGSDYHAPKATLSTTNFNPENIVVLPSNATSTQIYISAITDAIREGDETVTLKLIPNVETDDKGFSFQRYSIDSSNSQATLTINDSTAYSPNLVVTPADRTGVATIRAQLLNGTQQAAFDVRLTSQPQAAVTIQLSGPAGSQLSSQQLSFSSSNWTQPQRITVTNLASNQASVVNLSSSSSDSRYTGLSTSQQIIPSSWPSDLQLNLWEGGALVPGQPPASVQALDGSEGSNDRLGFELILGSPVVGNPIELLYQLSGGAGFLLDGSTADAVHTPERTYLPLVLNNSSSSGGFAYAEFSGLSTVSNSGEISAEAWVRRDAVTTAAGVLEFTDSNGFNLISLGFHEATGKPTLEIRDPAGTRLLRLIAEGELGLQEWNHLAYSVDAHGLASLYVDGELAKQGQLSYGSGLKISLYEGKQFESLRNTSAATSIDFNDSVDTAEGGDGETFSVRASGQIQARSNGDNAFAVLSDDGVRVKVNGLLVVDNWTDHGATWNSFTVPNLVAGEWYDIEIEYYEHTGYAQLQLADQPNGTPITALRHVPLYTGTRSLNSIGRTAVGSNGTGYLSGAVRGVGIWNAARSQDQIQASMLAAAPAGTGLISGLPLNGSTANSVQGGPAAVLRSGSTNKAAFATTPFHGLQVPAGASSVSLPIVPIDDLTAEGTEGLSLTLLDAGRYSLGVGADRATAELSDNESAAVQFLTDGAPTSSGTDTTPDTAWSSSAQFRVREEDVAEESITLLGIRLGSQPSAPVTLTLDPASFQSSELNVFNPADPGAASVALLFNPDSWDQVQTLHLQGVDDNRDDDDKAQTLRFSVGSSDAVYAGLQPSISVLTLDDDASEADPSLATDQSATAPLISLSSPNRTSINESGNDSATFTISLPQAASEETLVFLEVDPRSSQVVDSDVVITAGSGVQSLAGLTRFKANSGAAETSSLDSDGIEESSTAFANQGQTGDFSSTWSGYLYIPENGSYNFSIPVQGGVRFRLDNQVLIDKLFDTQSTWSTGPLQLNRGDFLAITLDYQSFNTSAPSVALQWSRPSDGGTTTREEVVPSQYLSRTDGFTLLIPKGSSSGSFTIEGAPDQVDENNEDLVTSLLESHGVEIVVKKQVSTSQLTVTLATTDRESINLAAGTVLTFGEDVASTSEASEAQSSAIATFTLSSAATVHRDRSTTLTGDLVWTADGQSSPYSSSIVGLVAGQGSGLYQVPDPTVMLTLTAPLTANGSTGYLASLKLEVTNLGGITLAAGTMLTYVIAGSDGGTDSEFIALELTNTLTLQSGETRNNVAVNLLAKSSTLDPTATDTPLQGLSSAYEIPNSSVVQLKDDDTAGLLFSLDAAGTQPIDASRVSLSEQGSSLTRYVRLTSQPADTVTVTVETTDASEALLQVPGSDAASAGARVALTFTPGDWQSGQAFTILPADDRLVDGAVDVDLRVRSTSGDSFYAINEDVLPRLPLKVKDNDTANLLVELQQSSISKAGNGFINLSLTSQPTDDVIVSLIPDDEQFTINDRSIGRGETLVFTPENWSTVQSVSLWAVDDNSVEEISSSQLQIGIASNDAAFNALSDTSVRIDIVDNDPPQAQIALVSDSSEDARPGGFQIALSNQAPSSEGSTGILVNYEITAVSLDATSVFPSTPSSIDEITQSPGAITGQVRIAPGKSSSDVIVVPIDDFVADKENKRFTVQLKPGDGYSVSNDSATNSSTVQIINNDQAGVVLFTSGERVRVKESGGEATYQLALLSQPTADVTVTIGELIPSGGSRQLGSNSSAYSETKTFTPGNWYIPQQISVQSYDDARIEDGDGENKFSGIHAAQLSYSFSSSDRNYDTASNKENASYFTNTLQQTVDVVDYELPIETANALQSSLTSLQEGIESLSLPIVGSLDGKTGGGLRKFITNLVAKVRDIGTPTPSKLSQLLSKEIAGALGIPENAVTVSLTMQGTEAVVVGFQFADAYELFSVPLAADFGLPGLGFKTEGTLDAAFSYGAGLELVLHRNGDIYLNTESGKTYLNANFNTSLSPDFRLTGGLGFLQLDARNQASPNDDVVINDEPASTELNASFDLNLNGGSDDKLSISDLTSIDLEGVFQYAVNGDAAMSFGVTTSVNGSAAIPSFSFDLSSKLALFDYSNSDEAIDSNNTRPIYFDNIKLDLGSFITKMMDLIVDGLDSILNPLYPIVDALYSDTRIFDTIGIANTIDTDEDGAVSAIDLASWFANFYAKIDAGQGERLKASIDATIEFLDMIKGVMDLIRDLREMSEQGNFYVDYGSYELQEFSAADASATTDDQDAEGNSSLIDNNAENLSDDTASQAAEGGSSETGSKSSKFSEIMAQLEELGFVIPLIDDPKNAIKLLLGQDVDLFQWTMPGMGMESEIEQSFPIYPGIEGLIEGGFGVDANIGFGFDTYGLNEWRKSGFKGSEAWKVFNGFYVSDWLDGEDVPEFSLDATMGAGLGLSALVVRADITGGLEAAASFDLLDEGEIAGQSDGKIRGTEISSNISNPLDLFELVGSLSAYLKSKVQVGIDMGFYSIWDTVWKETLAEIPLFEFGVGGSYGSGTVSNGYMQGTTVFWDSNRNFTLDSYEPSSVTTQDSHYNLRIEHRSFDRNRNARIDLAEGRLMAFGGVDRSTDLPLEVPFLAPLGEMMTPLTTLHTLALEAGYDEEAISAWMDQAFELDGFDYLHRDPVLELRQLGSEWSTSQLAPLAAYIAHSKLHFGWDVLVHSLQQLLSEHYPNDLETEVELISAFSQELLALPADSPIDDRLANAALGTIARQSPELAADLAPLAALAAALAANANWDLCQKMDALFSSAQQGNLSLSEALRSINKLKQATFEHYRASTDRISEGLYAISDPTTLRHTVQQRLTSIYSRFVKDQALQPGSGDRAAHRLQVLARPEWTLSRGATLTTTPFSSLHSLAQEGVRLSGNQLDFGLRRQRSSDKTSEADAQTSTRVLMHQDTFEIPNREDGTALAYYSKTDRNPRPFLYTPNSETGARFFDLGSDLGPVLELSLRDGQRGDRDPHPDVIGATGAMATLMQTHHFVETSQANVFGIAASDTSHAKNNHARNNQAAAVFVGTRMLSAPSSSNQIGCLVLRRRETWDPEAITLGDLKERIHLLGGTVAGSLSSEFGPGMKLRRDLQLTSGHQVVFLEIVDSSLEDLGPAHASLASLGTRIVPLESRRPASEDQLRLHSPQSQLKLNLSLSHGAPGLDGFLARQQHQLPVLDFSGLADMTIEGRLQLSEEGSGKRTVGFYEVLDASGAVRDPLTGRTVRPGEADYRRAALHAENLFAPLSGLEAGHPQSSSRNVLIQTDAMLAPTL
ncbi:MAG: PA14 domain-containing protein [Cyanobium sp.]